MVFVFIEILFKILLFKGGVLIYAEHCIYESFKLLLNEINQIENKNFFVIIIICDELLSIGTSNEETASQDHHLHLCDTDTENTSVLVNNENISLLFPPDTFMVIYFAGALRQDFVYCCADS